MELVKEQVFGPEYLRYQVAGVAPVHGVGGYARLHRNQENSPGPSFTPLVV